MMEDNFSSIHILAGTNSAKRAKHFDVRVKFVTDVIETDRLAIFKVRSECNLADAMPKPVPTPAFWKFRDIVIADECGCGGSN